MANAVQALLDLGRIKTAELHTHPYQWGLIQDLIPDSAAQSLINNFPGDHFEETYTTNQDKTYRMWVRQLLKEGKLYHPEALHEVWHDLMTTLQSPEYTAAMSELTGLDLSKLTLEVAFWRYSSECWLSPHCDKPEKVVTQLLYLNESWQSDWGGTLKILNSGDLDDEAAEVLPYWKNSALLIRSDRSWHAVSFVKPGVQAERRSVQIMWKK
ncbi:MAG TPA: 2OG-Fe(II) oxygenase [Herpetosiphonaceae bacterium]